MAVRAPTMHGTFSSRATMAAWQVIPPVSVTSAEARRMVGSQSGLVILATSTSPSCRRPPSLTSSSTRTTPEAAPGTAGRPWTSTSCFSAAGDPARLRVVIGRVCTM